MDPDDGCEWTKVEYPIWGIAREGTAYDPFDWSEVPPDSIYSRDLERKVYELTDHLGNARVVLKDWKQSTGTVGVRPYEASIGQYSNIYPFGMEQPGRSWNGGAPYRYGYNGMETSPETGGENYTTYFRQYDARLGRWMSTDPVTHEWESPYAAMGSNPVVLSDPSGADPPDGPNPLNPTKPSKPSSGSEVVWKSDESAIARNLEALMPKHRLFSMPKIDRAGGQAYVQSQGVQRSDGTTPKSWSRRKRSTEEMAYLRSLPPSTHPSGTESAPGVIRFGQGVVAGLLIGGLDFMNDPLGTTGRGIKNTAGTFGLLWLASKGDGVAIARLAIGVDNFLSLPAEEMGFEIGRSTVETAPLMVAGAVVIRASTLGLSARGAGLFAEEPAALAIHYRTPPVEAFDNLSKVKPIPGVLDVGAHGSPTSVEVMTNSGVASVNHRVLAGLIQSNPEFTGQPIRLLSCHTGALPNGFAQNLANKLGVRVMAPSDVLWVYPNGDMFINPTYRGSSSLNFRIFIPGGTK